MCEVCQAWGELVVASSDLLNWRTEPLSLALSSEVVSHKNGVKSTLEALMYS